MKLLQLPFVRGQSDKEDSKVAPLGVLKSLENGRIDRDGRIIKRPGFAVGSLTRNDGTAIGSVQTVAARGDERVLVGDNAVHAWSPTLARWRDWNKLPRVGVPERHAGARNKEGDSASPSIAYAAGFAGVVYENPTAAGSSYIHAIIYDVANWSVRSSAILELTGGMCGRVIAVGTTLVALWFKSSTTELKFSTFDLSSPTATWSAPAALQNDLAFTGYFDALPWSVGFAYVYANNAGTTSCFFCGLNGVTVGSATFANQGPCAFYAVAGEATTVAVLGAGGNLRVVSWPASGGHPFSGAVVGPTLVETNGANAGFPTVARKTAAIRTVGWSRLDSTPGAAFPELTSFCEVTAATNALSSFTLRPYVLLASKALYVSGRIYFVGVTKSTYDRTLFLLAHTQFSAAAEGTDETVETTIARGAARDWVTSRNHPELLTYVDANGVTQLLTSFHFLQSGSVSSANPFTAIDIATVPFGGTERLQAAQYGGLLYLSGGLLSVFDGEGAHELGFLHAPRIILLTPAAGGSMTASSTYRYLMTVETYDAMGGRHVSQVSDVYTVALGVGQTQVTLTYHPGLLSNRRRMWNESAPVAERSSTRLYFWRTAANGTLFQRITGDDGVDGLPYPSTTAGGSLVDQMSDATLTATGNPFVYTQGQRGGLSGPLQHDPPPPCKYLAFGKARAVVGGLEQPDEVRFSKFFFPGEPVEFSEDFAFRRRVQGKVTAVAYLDDAAIVFTRDRVFAVFGDGPDDSGAGSFADPVEVPSEAGCLDWRSVVATPLGLFFQGRSDRLYLLPRGLGSPVWIGEPVRDQLAANPTITGAALQAEKGLAVFMCCNPGANTSRSLVFDLRSRQWSVDKIGDGAVFSGNASRLTVWGGLLVYAADAGYYVEGAAFSDAGTWYGVTIETHALRPHGLQADGRTRKLAVLGEYRAISDLDVAIAPDDAQAFTAGPTWSLPFSGAAAGDPFRVEWSHLPVQKFGSVRVRVRERQNAANLTEALRFNGLTLETEPRRGMPRLPAAQRG